MELAPQGIGALLRHPLRVRGAVQAVAGTPRARKAPERRGEARTGPLAPQPGARVWS